MRIKEYNWTRYCSEHGGTLDSSNRGWLEIAEQDINASSPVERLDEYSDVPCLILLGEPGEGKTKELERIAFPEIPIRLGSYSEERRLRDDLRQALSKAADGSSRVVLFLDSLDEVLFSIRTAADVLLEELERVRSSLHAVRLRISCRTGAWPTAFEERLRNLWERSEDVVRRTLLPLTRDNVILAAKAEGLDGEAFVSEVETADIVPLASRPATLLMLLELFRQAARLPTSRWELYDQATQRLATEPLARDERGTSGALYSSEHRAIVALMASIMLLGNYAEISRRFGTAGPSVLDPSQVCGWETIEDGRVLQVSEDAVKEVLRGGLFTGVGSTRRFSHRTFGEFLCAWRLARPSNTLEGILELLRAGDTLVRPQLHEVAGWVAVARRDLWEWLAENEPSVLLLGDTAVTSSDDRKMLTETLLSLCHQRRLVDYVGGWDEHLNRLDHPALPQQLARWVLRDSAGVAKDNVSRRVALRIAHECAWWRPRPTPQSELIRWSCLAEAALSLALDSSEEPQVRDYAALVVDSVGDTELIFRLTPLLVLPREQDPELQLKGHALRALWSRRMIDAEELFQHLQDPPGNSYIGVYWLFVQSEFFGQVTDDELPIALRWIASGASPEPYTGRSVRRVLMERAWQSADNPAIRKDLVSAIIALLETHEATGLSPLLVKSDSGRHRQILQELVRAADDDQILYELRRQSLIGAQDLAWLLEAHQSESEESTRDSLRLLIRLVLELDNPSHGPLIIEACTVDSVLEREFRLLEPWRLDDPVVVRQRESDRRGRERNAKKHVRPAEEVINERLRSTSEDAWWGLWHALALEGDTDHPKEPWGRVATNLPGWDAYPNWHSQVRDAAERYLRSQNPQTAKWLGTGHFNASVLAGVAAIQVLATDPDRIGALGARIWRRWTPAFVAQGRSAMPDSARVEILRHPEVVADTINEILGGSDSAAIKAEMIEFSLNWWCPPVEELVHELASRPQDVVVDRAALKVLSEVSLPSFEAIAWKRLSSLEVELGFRANAAAAIYNVLDVSDAARWWLVLSHDEALTHKVIEVIAQESGFILRKTRSNLPAEVVESLYLWLVEHYPPEDDPGLVGGVRFLGVRDQIAEFRDSLIEHLSSSANGGGLVVLERLEARFPERLRWKLATARIRHRTMSWKGWSPSEVRARLLGRSLVPPQPAQPPLTPPRRDAGMIELDDLFPERSFPKYTYVQLPQHMAIRRVLERKSKALLVEGPAATGKTLAVRHALNEMGVAEARRYMFSCADPSHRKRLRAALDAGIDSLDGYLIVDDAHRVDDESLLKDLVGAVKTAVDQKTGPRCVLIGTHVGLRSLLSAFPDASHSVETVTIRASNENLRGIVTLGASELRVEVENADALVSLAGGSAQIMQLACYLWFRSSFSAKGSHPSRTTVDVDRLRLQLLERFEPQSQWIEQFVTEMGQDSAQRGVVMALLWALGRNQEGKIRRDNLPAGILWEQRSDELEHVFSARLSAELPFRITNGVLSVEDLRAAFLLRNWSAHEWSSLAARLGAEVWFQPGVDVPGFPPRKALDAMEQQFLKWKDYRDIVLQGLRCKNFHRHVYLLGSTERRVTFYAQQCRALSLIHALLDTGELEEGSKLAIVGGGLSGMTVAVAAARKGCHVTVYEKEGGLMPRQAAAGHRWVHPQIYDALSLPESAASGLPVLPWVAGFANDVVRQIRNGWEKEKLDLSPRLKVKTCRNVIGLEKTEEGKIRVVTQGAQEPAVSVVVVAIGFGPEKVKIQNSCVADAPGYWDGDLLSSEELSGSVLVSGAGDGGLVDLARALITGFNHEKMLGWLLETEQLLPLREFIEKRENTLSQDVLPTAYEEVLEELPSLRELFLTLPKPMSLRKGVKVAFVYNKNPYDRGSTSPVNRMIASLLLGLRNDAGESMVVQNSFGLHGWLGGKVVKLSEDGDLVERAFDHLVVRHGPDRDYVWRSIGALERDVARMRQDIRELDLTRRLHPETVDFFEA